ncbi:NAD(P)-dependent oxidoreductase [Desulfosarcina widdelii]|uniref:dTDP-4-dehydrorhamnose reductase n=1 Tax=Desulfosarcina widdelii TaxID=947919 RepID=A0A5K7Z969_9BACT|nr:dTDP-4-dehydrorhamnose reductase [Desulfosarcina widdelii]BBO73017.1 NAD(P)-dependent oxidoreductase [Desulfosarcina widdelii]
MTILIIGNKGQLGWALERSAENHDIKTVGVDLPELDMTHAEALNQLVGRKRWAAVVNAAAYTAVDKAECDVDTAFAVNRDGVAHLADACREHDLPLIHISTDYVFNGRATSPYTPDDPIDPLGIYGQSKAAGEKALRERLDRHVIIRTSWLYGIHGNNFVKTMLRLARERKELRVVFDQYGCPTYAGDLADAILQITKPCMKNQDLPWGTFHYCNKGIISWHRLARQTIQSASRYEKFQVETIVPITTEEYPTPAPRPAYSALDCTGFTESFGIEMVDWKDSLDLMVDGLYT